jgi:drug/metabolite transporter (DMT)-like permease
MVEAFRRAPTAVVSPIIYLQFIWAALSGVLVFGEMPGMGVVVGAAVVSLSGIALILWATPKPPAST